MRQDSTFHRWERRRNSSSIPCIPFLADTLRRSCNWKWGQAAHLSKPARRPGWWKGNLLYFGCWQLGGRWGGQMPVQRLTPPLPTDSQWARAFRDRRRGRHTESAQSALIVILKSVTGGLLSVIMMVLSTVNLQFQGQFVSMSWGQFWELGQLIIVWLTSSTCWGFQTL